MRGFLILAFLGGYALSSAVAFTHDPNSFAPDDSILWSQFGDGGAPVPAGTPGTTVGGLPFTVTVDSHVIGGALYSLWDGQGNSFDPQYLGYAFADGLYATGATITPGWTTFGYTVAATVDDPGGNLLGTYSEHFDAGHSSVWLGVLDAGGQIGAVTYSVATDDPHVTSDFSLSPVDLATVPEPTSLLALAAGLLLALRRRRPQA